MVVRGVVKQYPSLRDNPPVRALDGVNLRVGRGTVSAVSGDSGSGKTTLLGLIGGLDTPDAGSIVVDGQEITEFSEKDLVRYRAFKVGFIFQSYYLVPSLSAVENIEFGLEPLGIPATERRERAIESLRLVGMKKRAHFRPNELSGGEQQRVGIARAIAKRPTLLLADEPTGNLDRKNRHVVVEFLLRAARESGVTTIVVTHDRWIAEQCDVEHKIKNGRITKTTRRARPPKESVAPVPHGEGQAEEDGSVATAVELSGLDALPSPRRSWTESLPI